MQTVLSKSVLVGAMTAVILTASFGAQAVDSTGQPGAEKPHKKAAKNHAAKNPRAKFIQGSEETVAQRTARLKRECKGGVNAGACAGFTR